MMDGMRSTVQAFEIGNAGPGHDLVGGTRSPIARCAGAPPWIGFVVKKKTGTSVFIEDVVKVRHSLANNNAPTGAWPSCSARGWRPRRTCVARPKGNADGCTVFGDGWRNRGEHREHFSFETFKELG